MTRVAIRKVVRRRDLGACHEWQGSRIGDYGRRMYKRRVWLAHRAAWDEQVGPIPDGMFVCHHCDNPLCVNTAHLFIGTASDNMRDMAAKGRQRYDGEHNSHAILSDKEVDEIRRRYTGTKGGNPNFVSQKQLAIEYGVTQAHISKIVRNIHR